MEYKIYKAKFWRDRIWTALIPGILGLLMFLFGAAATGVEIYLWLKGEYTFWAFLGTFSFFSGPFILVGGVLFYILLAGIRTKIIITDEFLIYDAPLYKKRVLIQDIKGIAFRKGSSTIVLFYEKKGKIKELELPGWRGGYYFSKIAGELKKVNPNIQIRILERYE